MAVFTITTKNPDLGYVISKNPATLTDKGRVSKLKKGSLLEVFFSEGQGFALAYKDHAGKGCYSDRDVGYLDFSGQSHPCAYVDMLSEKLRTIDPKKDHPGECKITANPLYIKSPRFAKAVSNWASENLPEEVTCEVKPKYLESAPWADCNIYSIEVKAPTVTSAMSVMFAALLVARACESDKVHTKEEVARSIQALIKVDATYAMFRLLMDKSVPDEASFKELASLLPGNIRLKFGANRLRRLAAIRESIAGVDTDTLVDIGCSEMFNSFRLMKNFKSVIGVDIDSAQLEHNRRKFESIGPAGVSASFIEADVTSCNIKDLLGDKIHMQTVLMTEFLEHLEWNDSVTVLKSVLECKPKAVVVTVPAKDFNKYYHIDPDCFRHPDHKWEATWDDVEKLKSLAGPYSCSISIDHGDVVDGIPVFFTLSYYLSETSNEQSV